MDKISKANVLVEPGKFEMKEYPILEPVKDGAVIKVVATGICGTDVHIFNGQCPGKELYPSILGHEVVGKIVKKGSDLFEDSQGMPLSEGDHVFVAPAVSCNTCYKCSVAEISSRCSNKKAYGFNVNPDLEPHLTGGYADYMQVFIPNTLLLKFNCEPKAVAVLEPLSVALHALEKAAINLGEVVVIQGSGPIGILAAIGAKKMGASKVIVIGAPKGRLELAASLGADITINIDDIKDRQKRIGLVKEYTPNNLGPDVVIECAGVPSAVSEGLEILRDGGRFVEIGNFTDNGEVEINPFKHIVAKSSTIYGAWGSYPKHFVRGLRMIEAEPELYENLVTHEVKLEQVEEVMEALTSKFYYEGRDVLKAIVKP